MNKCNCKPKLYHWEDCANPSCHGYFYGCKEHNVRTLLGVYKDIPTLKQDWEDNIYFEGDGFLEDAIEITK